MWWEEKLMTEGEGFFTLRRSPVFLESKNFLYQQMWKLWSREIRWIPRENQRSKWMEKLQHNYNTHKSYFESLSLEIPYKSWLSWRNLRHRPQSHTTNYLLFYWLLLYNFLWPFNVKTPYIIKATQYTGVEIFVTVHSGLFQIKVTQAICWALVNN